MIVCIFSRDLVPPCASSVSRAVAKPVLSSGESG